MVVTLAPKQELLPNHQVTLYSAIHPVIRKVLKMGILGVPCLVGRYGSYLLPKQALATHIEKHNETL